MTYSYTPLTILTVSGYYTHYIVELDYKYKTKERNCGRKIVMWKMHTYTHQYLQALYEMGAWLGGARFASATT